MPPSRDPDPTRFHDRLTELLTGADENGVRVEGGWDLDVGDETEYAVEITRAVREP